MVDFRLKSVFNEIEKKLKERGAKNIEFEDTDKKNVKILCVDWTRVGKIIITYPDCGVYEDRIDCCNVALSFEYYVKEDENKFEWFIDNLINLSDARFKK